MIDHAHADCELDYEFQKDQLVALRAEINLLTAENTRQLEQMLQDANWIDLMMRIGKQVGCLASVSPADNAHIERAIESLVYNKNLWETTASCHVTFIGDLEAEVHRLTAQVAYEQDRNANNVAMADAIIKDTCEQAFLAHPLAVEIGVMYIRGIRGYEVRFYFDEVGGDGGELWATTTEDVCVRALSVMAKGEE